MARARLEDLAGGDAAENAALLRAVVDGEPGPRLDIVVAQRRRGALHRRGRRQHRRGRGDGAGAVAAGAARAKLDALVATTRRLAQESA